MPSSCRVTIADMEGIEHTVQVAASTLYEAVALGLKVLKKHLFTGELTEGAVQVQIEGPAVEHTVRLRDFYQWVQRTGGVPRDIIHRKRVQEILK